MKKIPTLFKREFACHKVVSISNEITEGCEDAFLHGIATTKYDGSCCAIINGKFYKRFDFKPGRKLPENAIPCQEEADEVTGHFPHWVPVDFDSPEDKWFAKAYNNTVYRRLEKPIPDGTYEAIGKHFNGNPYYMPDDTLVRHGMDEEYPSRTFEGISKYLEKNEIEGIVFWLDGKPVCKIKRTDFGLEWPVKRGWE